MLSMFRYRRYRAFVAFAVISIFALYEFTQRGSWEKASAIGTGSLRQWGIAQDTAPEPPAAAAVDKVQIQAPDHDALQAPPVTTSHVPLATRSTLQDVVATGHPLLAAVPTKSAPPALKSSSALGVESSSIGTSRATPSPAVAVQGAIVTLKPIDANADAQDLAEVGLGRLEVSAASGVSKIHWTQQSEHFPVSSTIQLPSSSPTMIPRIQHKFGQESTKDKAARLVKLNVIKEAAVFAWQGYKANAWLADEVLPVSGGKRNPFCGWAATLVDALDTLWIMGMKDEFEEAVAAVGTIDFTTSIRKDIPLFETTIRYLGGMLAAYDISGAKHRVLLDQSVQLADILMGAFDTPNRMPMTYYHWMPTFASQPHRATSRVILAELGSLSVEFTRLAQLTGEPKYYDAIARITNAFEEWQSREQNGTLVPGLFPTYIDASGCEKPVQMDVLSSEHARLPMMGADGIVTSPPLQAAQRPDTLGDAKDVGMPKSTAGDPSIAKALAEAPVAGQPGKTKIVAWDDPLVEGTLDNKGLGQVGSAPGKGKIMAWGDPVVEGSIDKPAAREALLSGHSSQPSPASKQKRQLGGVVIGEDPITGLTGSAPDATAAKDTTTAQSRPELAVDRKLKDISTTVSEMCVPHGLDATSRTGTHSFTLGGMADSTYEYLSKEYILLGGLEDKYRIMYEKAIDAATEKLLFRPMAPGNPDVLLAGEWKAYHAPDATGATGRLVPEGAHLTCFAGGMYALGARLFDRERDLDRAIKLTNGCVWAYASTTTGIMPEQFLALPCDNLHECPWNATKYHEALDPYRETRTKARALPPSKTAAPTAIKADVFPDAEKAITPVATNGAAADARIGDAKDALAIRERDATADTLGGNLHTNTGGANNVESNKYTSPVAAAVDAAPAPAPADDPTAAAASQPTAPLSHAEFVAARIADERLPAGITRIGSRKYILRPEAIESVFYLYRITGDEHWRRVGWEMWQAVARYTIAPFGASAIDDVTKAAPRLRDEEESFWLAETLKYFYLLFEDEEVLSLDQWVLNTEAHPFKRPDYVEKQKSTAATAA